MPSFNKGRLASRLTTVLVAASSLFGASQGYYLDDSCSSISPKIQEAMKSVFHQSAQASILLDILEEDPTPERASLDAVRVAQEELLADFFGSLTRDDRPDADAPAWNNVMSTYGAINVWSEGKDDGSPEPNPNPTPRNEGEPVVTYGSLRSNKAIIYCDYSRFVVEDAASNYAWDNSIGAWVWMGQLYNSAKTGPYPSAWTMQWKSEGKDYPAQIQLNPMIVGAIRGMNSKYTLPQILDIFPTLAHSSTKPNVDALRSFLDTVLLHEFTHASNENPTVDAGGEHSYGFRNCKNMSPTHGIYNAESYAFFAAGATLLTSNPITRISREGRVVRVATGSGSNSRRRHIRDTPISRAFFSPPAPASRLVRKNFDTLIFSNTSTSAISSTTTSDETTMSQSSTEEPVTTSTPSVSTPGHISPSPTLSGPTTSASPTSVEAKSETVVPVVIGDSTTEVTYTATRTSSGSIGPTDAWMCTGDLCDEGSSCIIPLFCKDLFDDDDGDDDAIGFGWGLCCGAIAIGGGGGGGPPAAGGPVPGPAGSSGGNPDDPEDPDEDEDEDESSTTTEAPSSTCEMTTTSTCVTSVSVFPGVGDEPPTTTTLEENCSTITECSASATDSATTVTGELEGPSGTPDGEIPADWTFEDGFRMLESTGPASTWTMPPYTSAVPSTVSATSSTDISTPEGSSTTLQVSTTPSTVSTSETSTLEEETTTSTPATSDTSTLVEETTTTPPATSDTSTLVEETTTSPPATSSVLSSAVPSTTTGGEPLCVPFQNPRDSSQDGCQCSSAGVVTKLPFLTGTKICGYTDFTVAPTEAPSTTEPPEPYTYTTTETLGGPAHVVVCDNWYAEKIWGTASVTKCEEPSSTVSTIEPERTGNVELCAFVGTEWASADCFIVCGGTNIEYDSFLKVIKDEDLLWEDNEIEPWQNHPWEFGYGEIGVQEKISYTWDREAETCGCKIDDRDVEGIVHMDGDSGFFNEDSMIQCACEFDCHLS